jgi:hypothetical protein
MPLNGTDQDVNLINVPYLQHIVKSAFYPQPASGRAAPKAGGTKKKSASTPASSTITVDVYNGSGVSGLAGSVSRALAALGYKAGAVENAAQQSQTLKPATQVFYGAGASANAASIAAKLGTTATALSSLPSRHVEVLLGSTVTTVPAGLASSGGSTASAQSTGATIIGARTSGAGSAIDSPAPSSSSTASSSTAPSSTAGADNGMAGGALTVSPNARYGIPCVN